MSGLMRTQTTGALTEILLTVPSEDAAKRVLQFLGAYENTATAFYDGSQDTEAVTPAPVTVKKPIPPKKVDAPKLMDEPADAWADALAGISYKAPIFDASGKQQGERALPVEGGRVEGRQREKLSYFIVGDDSMRGFRLMAGDRVLIHAQSAIADNVPMLIELDGRRMLRVLRAMKDNKMQVIAMRGNRPEISDHFAAEIDILGRALRNEIEF